MNEVTAVKDGKVYCTYHEDCHPDEETMRSLKAAGYKLYQNGKIYRPNKKEK